MRVRSLLLGVCMVVVPLLAMFSHHLPPRLFVTARKTVWEPVAAWAGWKPVPPPRSATVRATPEPRPDPSPALAVAAQPSASRAMAAVLPAAAVGGSTRLDRRPLEDRLAQLGATATTGQHVGATRHCQPVPGGSDMLASCRVAVDPAGQLQRVFQAAGADVPAALGRLVAEVEAWRHRTASRASAVPGS
jgi:hypothetical protein